jgi:hypothetical protein
MRLRRTLWRENALVAEGADAGGDPCGFGVVSLRGVAVDEGCR